MKLILLMYAWGLTASQSFANSSFDPAHLKWIETLESQREGLIENYKEKALAFIEESCKLVAPTKSSQEPPSSQQCPQTELDENSKGRKPLSKISEESLQNRNDVHHAKKIPQLLVFVSFSMNRETLKSLAQSLKKVGGALVFRGLVKDSFKETAKAFQELGEEALIDPTLFRDYQITTVPTFILREVGNDPHAPIIFDKVCGNITLDAALVQFAEKGEVRERAHVLLHQLRGKN